MDIKKLLFPVVSGVLVGAMVISSAVNVIGALVEIDNTQKIIDANTVVPIEYEDETALTEGLTTYKFEAEQAQFNGKSSNNGATNEKSHACAGLSAAFDQSFSGGMAIKNVWSSPAEEKLNEFLFNITSDKNVTVNLTMSCSGAKASSYTSVSFLDLYEVKVNKKGARINLAMPYTEMGKVTEVTFPVNLIAGENAISIRPRYYNSSYMGGVFDYISIDTTAALTGFVPATWDFSEFTTEIPPAAERLGVAKCTCTTCGGVFSNISIPNLTNGIENGIYTKITDESGATPTHSFYYTGTENLVTSDPLPKISQHKLTIKSEFISFKDGTKEAQVWKFHDIPEITGSVAGYEVVGWYNVANKAQTWKYNTFAMPASDITIAPIFGTREYCYDATTGTGLINLMSKAESYNPIHSNGLNGFSAGALVNSMSEVVLIDSDGFAQTATQYSYSNVKEGNTFITCNVCKTAMSVPRELHFTIQNTGTSKLVMEVIQTSASTTTFTLASNPRFTVSLNPGETTKFSLPLIFGNSNVLTGIKFLQDAKDMKFAMTQYVKEPTNGTKYTATIQNVDGSNYKALFGTSTSAKIEEGKVLTGLSVNAPEGYELGGWINANDKTETWIASEFKMPAKNVTLIPYFRRDAGAQLDQSAGYLVHPSVKEGFELVQISRNIVGNFTLVGSGENAYYEYLYSYKYPGGVQDGWYFLTMNSVPYMSGSFVVTYTIINNGTEAITITLRPVSSSGEVLNTAKPSATATIQPGECVKMVVNGFGIANNNFMTGVIFSGTTSSDMNFSMATYYQK